MTTRKENLNRDLYGFLKSHGYKPQGYLSSGDSSGIPEKADFFQFDFMYNGKDYGKISVSIDGSGNMKVYYGDDVEKAPSADSHDSIGLKSLRRYLSRFRYSKGLKSFELADNDDLEPDMKKREHDRVEGLNEGYYPMGKTKSYSDNVPSTRIIIQHNRQIEEGEQRYRNIAKIFVENMNGERFLLPTTKPGIARVYARHISEGGTPYDERGLHITSLCEEYQKMAGFVRATKNRQFNESAQKLINEGINHYNNLRETLHKMSGKRGYTEYFNNYKPALLEDEGVDLSEMFAQTSIDPRIENVMPILGKLSKNLVETEVTEVKELESWADNVIESSIDIDREKEKYIQAARDVLKGAKPEHLIRIRNLDPDLLLKHVGYAWDKVNKGEYKLNRPDLEETKKDELIGGIYDPDDFDDMVLRVKAKAKEQEKKKPVDMQDLARRLQAAMKQDDEPNKTNEGEITPVPSGHKGLNKQQKSAGQVAGTEKSKNIGPVLGQPLKQHPLKGRLVGAESADPLIRLKKMSGLEK